MKTFLLLVICMSSYSAFAQQKEDGYQSIYELLKRKPAFFRDDNIKWKQPSSSYQREIKMASYTIIKLPIDNMPCLVPDMKSFNMPVGSLHSSGIMPVR